MVEPRKTDWQEKYLQLVERHDAATEESTQQLEQLRRTLVRVSLAADGLDTELDQVLAALREHLKSKQKHNLINRLEIVEEAVLAFDERKVQRQTRMQRALETLIAQLRNIEPPRAVKAQLKTLEKELAVRVQQQQEYGALLEDYAAIQASILGEAGSERKSFFDKLLAKKPQRQEASESTPEPIPAVNASNRSVAAIRSVERETSGDAFSSDNATSDDVGASDPPSDNTLPIDLNKLAARVAIILRRLLDDIQPVDCVEQKIKNARLRISRGLNWRDLVPTLEDIRDLLLQGQLGQSQEFTNYLLQIDKELQSIAGLAKSAGDTAVAEADSRQALDHSLTQSLDQMASEIESATELATAKQTVQLHIAELRKAMTRPEPTQNSITEQIKQLLSQVEHLEKDAKKAHASLSEQQQKAQQDPLTELPNRAAYEQRAYQEFARWKRYHTSLSMAVVDIDHFKKVNDSFGHQAGDRVLRLVGKHLAKRLREVDFICRYGGEEFVVLLPQTTQQQAQATLDALRLALAETPFHFKNQPVAITVSIGVSEFKENDSVERVFARADKALYEAKNGGRNRVQVFSG